MDKHRSNTTATWQSCPIRSRGTDKVHPSRFTARFAHITPVDLESLDGEVQLTGRVPNRFIVQWTHAHHHEVLTHAVTAGLGQTAGGISRSLTGAEGSKPVNDPVVRKSTDTHALQYGRNMAVLP